MPAGRYQGEGFGEGLRLKLGDFERTQSSKKAPLVFCDVLGIEAFWGSLDEASNVFCDLLFIVFIFCAERKR